MTGRRWIFALSLLAMGLTTAVATTASAQTGGTSTDEEARARFEAGRAHYDAGRFREALVEFRAAYELSPRPLLLYNIYLASLDLGEIRDAADALRRYLASDQVDPAERGQLEARLRALDERIAREDAGGSGGGGEGGGGGGEGGGGGGGEGGGGGGGEGGGGGGEGGDTGGGGGIPTLTWISWGGAAAFTISAVVFGVLALSIESDILDECTEDMAGVQHCPMGRESDSDTGATFALISDISTGVAIVGAVVGTVVLLTSSGDDGDARAQRRGRRTEARAQVVPTFGPTYGGMAARLRF